MQWWSKDAVDVAGAIAARDVSAREVVQSVLDRIASVNPAVNAITTVLAEEALAAADAADAMVAAGDDLPPLHGVPVTTKVNADQAGQATTNGLEAMADVVAQADSPPVASLRHAGAIIVGRTNTPAFSLRWFTDNALHGRTLNPWNAGVSPGGSSGGAAVALACGMGAIGHGNDYGGSIRHPAAQCGVVGLRPTTGRVASFNGTAKAERPISSQLMAVQGPLARSVADVALALEVMSRPDPRDPLQVPSPPVLGAPMDWRPPVAVMRASAFGPSDVPVVAAIDRAAKALSDAGYEVEEVSPPHMEEATLIWRDLVFADIDRAAKPVIEAYGDAPLRTNLALMLEGRPAPDSNTALRLYERRLAIARDWSLFLARYPLVLTATSWRHGLPVDADQTTADDLTALVHAQSPLLVTAMLGLPGLSLPAGIGEGGLPSSVQLISRWFDERSLIPAAQHIETALGRCTPIDPRHDA